MIEKIKYLCWAAQNLIYRKKGLFLKEESNREKYGFRSYIAAANGNDKIISLLEQNTPLMIGRLGAVETLLMRQHTEIQLGIRKQYSEEARQQLCICAGFFPNESSSIDKFAELMKESLHGVDLLGVWYNPMENYFVNKYSTKKTVCTPLVGLEPWYYKKPWSKALYGKKVVVVHPFAESILEQYKKHEKLFPDNMIPDFELRTVKAVQTIAGQVDERFLTWFDALDYMYAECMKENFDIAIIGCGAYGFPLAAKLKQAGKQAIHLGGATQIMFGIKGKRWDEISEISKFYNEFWVRPNQNEIVKGGNKVENGCYW